MPYSRPTLSDLIAAARDDIAAALPNADPLLRFAVLNIVAKVLAGFANQHYGYIDWVSKNAVPFTAEDEFLYAWGALKDVFLKAAAKASGKTTFSNCQPGRVIAEGSLLFRGDQVTYVTTADATIAGDGTAVVDAIASEPGANTNCPLNTVLVLGNSIAGINTNSLVSTAFVGGADIESQEDFRSRMLQVYRNPPQGGAKADYERWALEVPGVTRAWCNPLGMGIGTVTVFFMMDDVRAIDGGFPQGTNGVATDEPRAAPAAGDQLLVANYIFGPNRQPVTALVYAVAPTNDPQDFEISGVPDGVVQAAIEVAIDDVFLADGSPGGTVNLLAIEAAIAAVPGSAGAVVVSPVDNITAPAGALTTRGNITWS